MYIHARLYVYVHVPIYTNPHIYTYTHMHMHTYTHTCTHGYRCMYLPTYTQIENLSKRCTDTLNNITPCSEVYTKMCVRMPRDISSHIRAQPRQRGYTMGLYMLYPPQPQHCLTRQRTAAKTYNLSTTVHTHTNTHVRTCIRISIHKHMHIYTYMHVRTHTYIHIYTHTHTTRIYALMQSTPEMTTR